MDRITIPFLLGASEKRVVTLTVYADANKLRSRVGYVGFVIHRDRSEDGSPIEPASGEDRVIYAKFDSRVSTRLEHFIHRWVYRNPERVANVLRASGFVVTFS